MAYGGVIRFSEVLKTVSAQPTLKNGCLVDTSILFAASYPPDDLSRNKNSAKHVTAEVPVNNCCQVR